MPSAPPQIDRASPDDQARALLAATESEALKAAILETALDCIITIDHQGAIVEFNPAAEATFGYLRADVLGKPMAELIIPPAQRELHYRGLAQYLASGQASVIGRRIEVGAMRSDGSEFQIELAVTRIPTEGPPLFTAYLRDITPQKNREQRRRARLAVTQIIAESASIGGAARGILEAVCRSLGWDAGGLWLVDRSELLLRCLEFHRSSSETYREFEAASRERTFSAGIGLPGRVWSMRQPVWIPDVVQDHNFPRGPIAVKAGLHAAFAFPVMLGSEFLGVIEFFSGQIREPDPDLLEMMATIGGQIGQFLERKQTEERLIRSEQRFAGFMQHLPGLAWIKDLEGRYAFADDAAARAFCRSHDTLYGHTDEEVFSPETAAQFRRNDARALASGSGVQVIETLEHADGTHHSLVSKFPIRGPDGQAMLIGGMAIDITDRIRAEAQARFMAEASDMFAALVDFQTTLQKVAALAVPRIADWCAVDIAESNHALRRLAAAHVDPSKVALIHELEKRYPRDRQQMRGAYHVLRTGRSEMAEVVTEAMILETARNDEHLAFLRALGPKSYISVPLKARDRTLGVITLVMADSARRYTPADLEFAEELARRASIAIENARLYGDLREADRLKDEFLAMLAHELRNPLAPIRNALQVMEMPQADADTIAEVREIAARQVQHMARLLDDLLDMSRISRGHIDLRKEPVEVAAVVNRAVDAVQSLIDERGLRLMIEPPAESLRVDGDPMRLEQVLMNLLQNAVKYTEPGGEVHISAERQESHAVLRVRDTGIGIAPDVLPRIFDLFVQADRSLDRSQGGIGIGLTLVRKLVELHGGTVEAFSSGVGTGSEFVVRLPVLVCEPSEESSSRVRPPAADSIPSRNVLVVDDNRDAADSLAVLLSLLGQKVRKAYGGREALDALRDPRPDLIFMDIGMPQMDGYEVARRIRQTPDLAGIMLIALTGWGQEEDRRRTREAGFDHHLVKPADLGTVKTLLLELASGPAPDAG